MSGTDRSMLQSPSTSPSDGTEVDLSCKDSWVKSYNRGAALLVNGRWQLGESTKSASISMF
eukprot:scaffold314775_cov34-Prasinocladus_malaysianus.AAC.1